MRVKRDRTLDDGGDEAGGRPMEDGHLGYKRRRRQQPEPTLVCGSETDGYQRDRVRAQDDVRDGATVILSRAQLVQQLRSGGKSGHAHEVAQASHGRGF